MIDAFEIPGFGDSLEVVGTLEKKDSRKESPEDFNQDTLLADPDTGLVGVLDGAGGMGNGDKASKAAERALPGKYKEALAEAPSGSELQKSLVNQMMQRFDEVPDLQIEMTKRVEAILETDPKLGKKAFAMLEAMKRASPVVKESKGATTAVLSQMHKTKDGRTFAIVVNTGDSGAMKRRVDGSMDEIVPEDSMENLLISKGQLDQELLKKMKKDPEAFHQFKIGASTISLNYKKMKVIATGGLGVGEPTPSLSIRLMRPGEELILGTDGLLDKFEDPDTGELDFVEMGIPLADEITEAGEIKQLPLKEKMDELRKEAKKRITYKKDDDVGIIGIRVKK